MSSELRWTITSVVLSIVATLVGASAAGFASYYTAEQQSCSQVSSKLLDDRQAVYVHYLQDVQNAYAAKGPQVDENVLDTDDATVRLISGPSIRVIVPKLTKAAKDGDDAGYEDYREQFIVAVQEERTLATGN